MSTSNDDSKPKLLKGPKQKLLPNATNKQIVVSKSKLPKVNNKREVVGYKPKLPKRAQGRALAVFDRFGDVTRYLNTANQISREFQETCSVEHQPHMARFATERRNVWLPLFKSAYIASQELDRMHGGARVVSEGWNEGGRVTYQWREPVNKVDRGTAIDMVTAMLGAVGAKGDRELMLGMLDMLESAPVAEAYDMGSTMFETGGRQRFEEQAQAGELWLPVEVSAASLALACRHLIGTFRYGQLRPADLHKACRQAGSKLKSALNTCNDLIDFVRRCDAVLLQFDRAEWERPYRALEYHGHLMRLLELHEEHLPWDWRKEDADGKLVHPFAIALRTEQTKLHAVFEAEERAKKLAPPPERKRIAAARKRSEVKRRTRRKRKTKPRSTVRASDTDDAPQERSLRPPASDPLADLGERQETRERERVNRDGLTEADFEERLGWGGYGIDENGLATTFCEDVDESE
jgi:hypothetical protein